MENRGPNLSLGNVGEMLANKTNVYFSKDAGLSWKKVNLQLATTHGISIRN